MSPRNVPVSTTVDAPHRRKCDFTIRCLTIGGAGISRPWRCHFRYTRHSVKGRIAGNIENLRQSVSTIEIIFCPPGARTHTFRKMRLRYSIHTGTKQTAVKLTE